MTLWFCVSALLLTWIVAVRLHKSAVRALDGSGAADDGVVIFVEPVRWLFVVWGFLGFCHGLRRGGSRQMVRLFRWSGRAGALLVLPDLMRQQRLLAKAEKLAAFIRTLGVQYPQTTIHLCGYSSGCYVAVEAVKRLDSGNRIGAVVLLAGSFSPGYDLTEVAAASRTVRSFHSFVDFIINGLGTLLFGCNDRRRSAACGMVGLKSRPRRVWQRGWSRFDLALGYLGDHFSITSPRFIAKRVVRILHAGEGPISRSK